MGLTDRIQLVYSGEEAHIRRKAPILFAALVVSLSMIGFGLAALLAGGVIDEGVPILLMLFVTFGFSLRLLFRKKFSASVKLLVWSTALLFCIMVFVGKVEDEGHVGYMLVVSLVPLLLQALFSSSLRDTILLSIFELLAYHMTYWIRVTPFINSERGHIAYILNSMFGVFFCGMILLLVRVNRKIRKEMEAQAVEDAERNAQLSELIRASRESLAAGSELQETSRDVQLRVDEITTHMEILIEETRRMGNHGLTVRRINAEAGGFLSRVNAGLENQNAAFAAAEESAGRISREAEILDVSAREASRHAVTLVDQAAAGQEALRQGVSSVQELTGFAQDMESIVSVIEDVAGRTALLAMNASIEAAHAGEAGRGFAVVASEISKLAAEADRNSRQIKDTLEKTRVLIGQAGETNGRVVVLFDSIGEWIGQVHRGMEGVRDRAKRFLEEAQGMSTRTEQLKAANGGVSSEVANLEGRLREEVTAMEGLQQSVQVLETRISEASSEAAAIASPMERFREIGRNNLEHMKRQAQYGDLVMTDLGEASGADREKDRDASGIEELLPV